MSALWVAIRGTCCQDSVNLLFLKPLLIGTRPEMSDWPSSKLEIREALLVV